MAIKKQTPPTSRNVRKQASLPNKRTANAHPAPTDAELKAAVQQFNDMYDDGADLPQGRTREYSLMQFMGAHALHKGTGIEDGGFAIDARYNASLGWFGELKDVAHYGGKSSRMFVSPVFTGWLLASTKKHYVVTHEDETAKYGRGEEMLFDAYVQPDDLPGLINPKCRSRIVLIVALPAPVDETGEVEGPDGSRAFKCFELKVDSYDTNEAFNAVRSLAAHLTAQAKAMGKSGLYGIATSAHFHIGQTYPEGKSTVTPLKITPVSMTPPNVYAALRPLREAAAAYVADINSRINPAPARED